MSTTSKCQWTFWILNAWIQSWVFTPHGDILQSFPTICSRSKTLKQRLQSAGTFGWIFMPPREWFLNNENLEYLLDSMACLVVTLICQTLPLLAKANKNPFSMLNCPRFVLLHVIRWHYVTVTQFHLLASISFICHSNKKEACSRNLPSICHLYSKTIQNLLQPLETETFVILRKNDYNCEQRKNSLHENLQAWQCVCVASKLGFVHFY